MLAEIKIEGLEERLLTLEQLTRSILQKLEDRQESKQEWFKIGEAAKYLNTSVPTVRRLIKRKVLERALDTYTIRISRDSLEGYRKRVSSWVR